MSMLMKITRNEIVHILTRAVIGFLVGAGLYIACAIVFWTMFPYRTAEVEVPMQVLNENHIVQPDETLNLRLVIDKQSNYTPVVSRAITCDNDQTYFALPSVAGGTARPKGHYTTDVSFDIPLGIPDGANCTFTFINAYEVNPIRTINKVWTSEQFKVLTK